MQRPLDASLGGVVNLAGEVKRSGRDALFLLLFGILASAIVSWLFKISVASAGIPAFLVLGAVVLVHAPEDVPGAVDNPDGKLSYPLFLATAALLAALVLLVSAVLFPGFASLSMATR